jgi:FKBP-type peptidyl-prolyl cis-trans isomerase SlyD
MVARFLVPQDYAMAIAADSVVSFHYRVTTAEGEQVDQSEKDQPMIYLHGRGQMVAGVEEALLGHEAGDHVEARVEPEKGYGAYDQELDLKVPLTAFPEQVRPEIKPGFRFRAEHPTTEGCTVLFTIHAIEGDFALVSGNHPMAGKTLLFSLDVVAVRPATESELSHGHCHGTCDDHDQGGCGDEDCCGHE